MFTKIESWLTLGNQYVAATIVYLGLTVLLVGSTLLDHPQVLARGDLTDCSYTVEELREGAWVPVTYDGCPVGQKCCGDTCISQDDICCEDGTYGNADTCACLCCVDGTVTTITCEDEGNQR